MRPLRLYITDFMCYDHAYIDFTEFSAALIVGKQEHNDNVANGVGKTTIFKSIEYALFNYADVNLENIIRDDVDLCNVTLDFVVENQEYRVARTRTCKGTTDLTLYRRNAADGIETEVLHTICGDKYSPISDKKYWHEISGRRAADTEKELAKLIKVNIKSFRIFVHFMQHDFGGLTTATPEKRKVILRDALSLIIYTKLEKLAKEKSNSLVKEADKLHTMIETLGDPDKAMASLSQQLQTVETTLADRSLKRADQEIILAQATSEMNRLITEYTSLEEKFAAFIIAQKSLTDEKSRLETSIKEYSTKKSNVIKIAHDTVSEIKQLEEEQIKLVGLDYNQIDILSAQIISNKEKIAQLNLTIQNDMVRCEKLKKPIPIDGECEECRQPITAEHRKICQRKLDLELQERRANIQTCKKEITTLNTQNITHQQHISNLNLSKQHLEGINSKIAVKKKEIVDKRDLHDEYKTLLEGYITRLKEKDVEMKQIERDLKNSPIDQAQALQKQIQIAKQNIVNINGQISTLNKEITHCSNSKAVLQHDLDQKADEKRKKMDYAKALVKLESKLNTYPAVIQAFSNAGIPNLIIQNVLDDLQIEANNLLTQLKPGIQLSFAIEKVVEKTGEQADTLDINYSVGGKKRYYEQLSGAMRLAVNFSLKLGLSFLLQKMSGVDIKLLLLDEIDQSLDKASIDLFADLVKFFQRDYTILVITHNDRLQSKFANAILVEQDINMVSRARVVSSW